jgi:putative two-component system response regulator
MTAPALNNKPTVLVVDDTPANLQLIVHVLERDFEVCTATDGPRALSALRDGLQPSLILLDIMMPDMDGFEVCRRLKLDPVHQEVPVIFLTARTEAEDEIQGLQLGAVDFLTKPVRPAILRARALTHVSLYRAQHELRQRNEALRGEVTILEVSIRALAALGESLSREGGNRLMRIQSYVRLLAQHLREHPDYRDGLANGRIDTLVKATALYDIGKLGVSDQVLEKPGPLTPDEMAVAHTHAEIGGQALQGVIDEVEATLAADPLAVSGGPAHPMAFLELARDIAVAHHEHWDGNGYPLGLSEAAIPPGARLVALADVYDALISRRPYKAPLPAPEVRRLIAEGRGTRFDPVVVDAFLALEADFLQVWQRYADAVERY